MKKVVKKNKINFLKKIFIKICRIFGYEIIDQASFDVPTSYKTLDDTLSIPNKKSISIPLGQFKITRKIKSLKVIFRSCTNELIMDQNKKRLFDHDKNEYTFRALNSLLKSLSKAKKVFNKIDFKIIITDTNSKKSDIEKIKKILLNYEINNQLIEINLDNFQNKIVGTYSQAKFANMANLYTSLNLVKNETGDLIYFIEDDYIHTEDAVIEMLFTYEKFSSMLNNDIFLLPADYPYLYTKDITTKILFGHQKHWRLVNESLVSFLTSKHVILDNFEKLLTMANKWEDPWEAPLHAIYKNTPCFSPIPSLSMHCANINSIYGLPPGFNWKKIWEENSNY